MTNVAYKDLDGKSREEILSDIADYKKELLNLRFRASAGDLDNTSRFRQVRVNVARLYTKLNTNCGS